MKNRMQGSDRNVIHVLHPAMTNGYCALLLRLCHPKGG